MSWIDWLIMIIPMAFVMYMGLRSTKYVKGVSDYLAAGRLAGRYVIGVGDVSRGLAVITLIGYVESCYKTGFAMTFWENILAPLAVVISLTGFVSYRFRETKSMSMGQFLEMRYNRKLRFIAAFLRSAAELLANCMCPALAARFMIYYLGLPPAFSLFGLQIPTFLILSLIMISMCVAICVFGGNLSLMITDTIQGFFCYPLLVIFTIFILCRFSWNGCIIPVMSDRVSGQSFLNPYDVSALRDFNVFALVVTIYYTFMDRGSWIGTGASVSAKSPHEQKMADIMGTWRNLFNVVLYMLLVIVVIASLNHSSMANTGKTIRDYLSSCVLTEVAADNPKLQEKINKDLQAMPPRDHVVGGSRPQDAPLSHDKNLDTPHLDTVHNALKGEPQGERKYQEFFTLYHQMMLPVTLRHLLPVGMIGLFALFILLMMLSTDDSRLFSAAQTIAQDCVMPLMKKGFTPKQHVWAIRLTCVGCGLFWLVGSFFMSQLDYVNMFVSVMCSMWLGAGPIMIFGLYSRFGNTTGAFSSLFTGLILALLLIFFQRSWADLLYPMLVEHGWETGVSHFFAACSSPFEPWIVWRVTPYKFPINSKEGQLIISLCCLAAYVIGSLVTYKGPFNLDRMLHRGIYNTDGENKTREPWTFHTVFHKIVGITPEFTKGDRIISWSVFFYSFVYQLGISFLLVVVWNFISPWKPEWWGKYFFVVYLAVPLCSAVFTTIWFTIGGITDMKQLFHDLKKRVDDPLDNGQVEGSVSIADAARFAELERENQKKEK